MRELVCKRRTLEFIRSAYTTFAVCRRSYKGRLDLYTKPILAHRRANMSDAVLFDVAGGGPARSIDGKVAEWFNISNSVPILRLVPPHDSIIAEQVGWTSCQRHHAYVGGHPVPIGGNKIIWFKKPEDVRVIENDGFAYLQTTFFSHYTVKIPITQAHDSDGGWLVASNLIRKAVSLSFDRTLSPYDRRMLGKLSTLQGRYHRVGNGSALILVPDNIWKEPSFFEAFLAHRDKAVSFRQRSLNGRMERALERDLKGRG